MSLGLGLKYPSKCPADPGPSYFPLISRSEAAILYHTDSIELGELDSEQASHDVCKLKIYVDTILSLPSTCAAFVQLEGQNCPAAQGP